jgi:UDP-glucose 4-epimerase
MKRMVVTGGAGFIGSSLVRALLGRGERVHVIDNLSNGKLDNLEEVANQITVHEYDVADYDRIAPVIAGADRVFHLAAVASVPKSIQEPVTSHKTNIDGTFNVLRAAVEGKVGRVVFAASSAAYGDSLEMPKNETMLPRPKSPYATQKVLGEYYMNNFAECFGLETVSLRFFNVFGPRQDPTSPYSGVLSIFMSGLLERRSPIIFGDGGQSRDFIYVDDIVNFLLSASEAPSKAISGKVYNAGTGTRYTLNQVWNMLQQIEGVELAAKYGPERAGDIRDSQAEISAAVKDLGYRPQFSLEEGLRRTLDWYRTYVSSLAGASR